MAKDPRRRERLLIFLLLPAIVVAVSVLSWVSIRASFQLERLREQAVVEATLELANERAGRVDRLIVDQDNAVAGEVDVADLGRVAKRWLAVAARQTPTVRAVLVLDMGSSEREVVAFASRAPGLDDEQFRRLLVRKILSDLELDVGDPLQLRHLHRTYGEQSYLLSYWQRVAQGRRYLVIAWHDVPRIVHDYLPWLYSERDLQSRVNVVDSEGRIVFGPPLSGGEFTVGRPFQTTLYKWRLNVALTSAQELAEGAARRRVIETVLAVLSSLVVIAGIVVILVAVARERKLSNLKSEFVANVSHELKTPLSLVRMFGELLQSERTDDPEKRRQYSKIIVNESERLSALIENVLDFAKVERGQQTYQFARVSVRAVVASAVEACQLRAEREGVTLTLHVDENIGEATIDSHAVEVALINLIDNAIKYASDGREVEVAAQRTDKLIQFGVRDFGPGIVPEDTERIFERFVRGKSTKRVRGSGIGLALVKQVAQAHGGRAWVEEREPSGAAFLFTARISGA